jgi:hypothetical protein
MNIREAALSGLLLFLKEIKIRSGRKLKKRP